MTGRTRILVVTGLMALTLTVQAQVQDRTGLSLQAAIKKELVEGDLKGAIELFKQIAQDSNPEVAAEAFLHLAACYDKLGQAEARNTYERIVREYPNQKKAVAEARAWLDAHRGASQPTGVRVEQIWTAQDASSVGPPSANGRYVAFVNWTSGNGNLAVRDLITGENRLVTRDATSNAWAADTLVSPDGKQIAYRWVGGQDDSIRLIRFDGTGMRVLARRPYGDFLRAWSPDGRHLVAVHHNYGTDWTTDIILISTADGSITSLKSTGWQEPTIGGFSPDGRFLVYSVAKNTGRPGAVLALAVDGSREIPLVQGSANNWSPVWSPDGSRVVFLSDRAGTAGLWSIRIADGQPQGEPQLVRPSMAGISPLAFTTNGSYHYLAGNLWRDAYTAEFDPSAMVISKPALVTEQFLGANSDPVLSPDGRYVAFIRRTVDRGPGAGQSLIVRSLASGDERTIATATLVSYGGLLWFPDSRSVLVLDRANSRPRFRAVDVETGEPRTLFEALTEVFNTTALSPDGKFLFYTSADFSSGGGPADLKSLRLVKRHLETGEEAVLHRTESTGIGFLGLTVSSDGSKLAFSLNVKDPKRDVAGFQPMRSLMIMPADGGAPREIYRTSVFDFSARGAMIWTKDGKHLIVTARCGPGGQQQLCAIPGEGGALRPLGLGMLTIATRTISADGRRLFFTNEMRTPELWAIRNLLRESAKAR